MMATRLKAPWYVLGRLFCSLSLPAAAQNGGAPAGTVLEIRVDVETGTRVSALGDPIRGTVTAPVVIDAKSRIPAGTKVFGRVSDVKKVGLGLRRNRASISYEFDTVLLPGGVKQPLHVQLLRVDAAKEQVDPRGRVKGISYGANFGSTVAVYAWRLLLINPAMGVPIFTAKLVCAPSPDPEIYFPPGTEFLVSLTAPLELPEAADEPDPVRALRNSEADEIRGSLAALPRQRVETSTGKAADLVNVSVAGSRELMEGAFHAAGWSGVEKRSLATLLRSYFSFVERRAYPTAPMSPLRLGGRKPELEFQKGLNTFSKRHHVRLWRSGQMEDGTALWVGAATEDVGYRFAWSSARFTHSVDPRIDGERTKVVNDLTGAGCVEAAGILDRGVAGLEGRAPRMRTDGRVAAVRLQPCAAKAQGPVTRGPGRMALMRNDFLRSNFVSLGFGAVQLSGAVTSWWKRQVSTRRSMGVIERRSSFTASPPVSKH